MLAYFCFVNFGMAPSAYDALSYRDKVLMNEMIQKHKKAMDKLNSRR